MAAIDEARLRSEAQAIRKAEEKPQHHDTNLGEKPQQGDDEPHRYRWSATEFQTLADTGFFRHRRVELVAGDVLVMSPAKPTHSVAIDLVNEVLRRIFGERYPLRIQQPLHLGPRDQPEPDLAVVAGAARDFIEHPKTASLLVEVSDSTLRFDRGRKAHLYAFETVEPACVVNEDLVHLAGRCPKPQLCPFWNDDRNSIR
jgi:hypothetical protein